MYNYNPFQFHVSKVTTTTSTTPPSLPISGGAAAAEGAGSEEAPSRRRRGSAVLARVKLRRLCAEDDFHIYVHIYLYVHVYIYTHNVMIYVNDVTCSYMSMMIHDDT